MSPCSANWRNYPVLEKAQGADHQVRQAHGRRVWRLAPEVMYECLEEYFPKHDLDRPVIDVPSGGTCPMRAFRQKKSIRVVAAEHKQQLDRRSRVDDSTIAPPSRCGRRSVCTRLTACSTQPPPHPFLARRSSTAAYFFSRRSSTRRPKYALVSKGTYYMRHYPSSRSGLRTLDLGASVYNFGNKALTSSKHMLP